MLIRSCVAGDEVVASGKTLEARVLMRIAHVARDDCILLL